MTIAGSPDANAVVGCQVESFAGFDVEGFVPGIGVTHDVGAVLSGRVSVGEDLSTKRGLAGFGSPVLTVSDEELLVTGESILGGGFGSLQRDAIAIVGGGDSTEVGNVFVDGLLAVDVNAGERLVGVVLLLEFCGFGLKRCGVAGGPPHGE